jgi:hypothetical protein
VEECRALAECRVLFVGARATSGRMQALQTDTEAQQQGLRSVGMAIAAADRAVRWAVVSVLDGLEFQEREESRRCRALFHCRDADWPD